MALKKQGYECYSCSVISNEEVTLVKTLDPQVILSCTEFSNEIRTHFCGLKEESILELGVDIDLPLNPLKLLEKLSLLK